ncbi:hypothetical protein BDZ89DRAFT_1068914 [Hymenopellis radicata]|nr:hypothetical protein BDZ89DRAFT_1068914 [Hymenopellis radicata]
MQYRITPKNRTDCQMTDDSEVEARMDEKSLGQNLLFPIDAAYPNTMSEEGDDA